MSSKRRGNKRSFKRKRGRKSNLPAGFKNLQPIMPPKKHVPLRVITTAIISGAAPAVVKRWNPNSAYTPETGGGSGATPGYADITPLYGYYRVAGYSYEITLSNLEGFGVVVYVINSNADPTTSFNSTAASNPKCQSFSLSPKGGMDRHTFRGRFTIAAIVGSPAVKWDDIYSSLINASPADITWLGVGVQSIGGSNVTNGVCVEVKLTQYTIFYDYLLQAYNEVHLLKETFEDSTDLSSSSSSKSETSVADASLQIKPYIQVPASKDKEIGDFKISDQMYSYLSGVPVPLTVLMKRRKKVQGYVPFTVVY
jgi:hypothetical protein